MGISYPDQTNTTGIWKLSEIYKNKVTQGTWRGSTSGGPIGLFGGGSVPSDVQTIQSVNQTTTRNAVDFGDMTEGRRYPAGTSSNVRAIYGGGYVSSITDDIDHIQIASKGNATDYGNLSVTRFAPGTMSNNIRGLFGAGVSPSRVNTIDFCNFSSAGDATDFGDLVEVSFAPSGCSPLAGGIDQSFPREPELHSPLGRPVLSGGGVGDIGIFAGG